MIGGVIRHEKRLAQVRVLVTGGNGIVQIETVIPDEITHRSPIGLDLIDALGPGVGLWGT